MKTNDAWITMQDVEEFESKTNSTFKSDDTRRQLVVQKAHEMYRLNHADREAEHGGCEYETKVEALYERPAYNVTVTDKNCGSAVSMHITQDMLLDTSNNADIPVVKGFNYIIHDEVDELQQAGTYTAGTYTDSGGGGSLGYTVSPDGTVQPQFTIKTTT